MSEHTLPQQRNTAAIARRAARLIVEDGLDWAGARRRARRDCAPGPLPDNAQLEDAVREHIAVFCPQTQERQLHALRSLALQWMERLAPFRPHLGGAVWRGTATHLSDIHLQLFCEDPKAPEIALIDQNVRYHGGSTRTPDGREASTLSLMVRSAGLPQPVAIHLLVQDLAALRTAARPGMPDSSQRGDAKALRRLMEAQAGQATTAP